MIISFMDTKTIRAMVAQEYIKYNLGGRHGRDRMVVGLITTYAIGAYHFESSNPVYGEVYSIQHYVIKFVSDLGQVGDFLYQ